MAGRIASGVVPPASAAARRIASITSAVAGRAGGVTPAAMAAFLPSSRTCSAKSGRTGSSARASVSVLVCHGLEATILPSLDGAPVLAQEITELLLREAEGNLTVNQKGG